jgi:hypothetical protein
MIQINDYVEVISLDPFFDEYRYYSFRVEEINGTVLLLHVSGCGYFEADISEVRRVEND